MDTLIRAIQHHLHPMAGKVLSDFVLIECAWETCPERSRRTDGPEEAGHIADVSFQGENWPVIAFDSELALRQGLSDAVPRLRESLGDLLPELKEQLAEWQYAEFEALGR